MYKNKIVDLCLIYHLSDSEPVSGYQSSSMARRPMRRPTPGMV